MDQNYLTKIVNEELAALMEEAKEKAPKIEKELEKLRTKFFPEIVAKGDLGSGNNTPRMEKRMELTTVAELLEVPRSELMLHFLNRVKGDNERQLIEFHLGQVYFYGC